MIVENARKYATKDNIRNWGLAVIASIVATLITMAALVLASSGNQLSAFQPGLSAVEAITAAAGVRHDVTQSSK